MEAFPIFVLLLIEEQKKRVEKKKKREKQFILLILSLITLVQIKDDPESNTAVDRYGLAVC